MRLLIATIGVRDPESESGPTGPLTLALERQPQQVYLLPSKDTIAQAEDTRDRILQELKSVKVEITPLAVTNPASLPELMREMPAQVRAIWNEAAREAEAREEDLEIDCCPKSGTPQMTMTFLLFLASVPAPAPVTVYDVVEPRHAVDGVRIVPINPAALRQREEINLALEYFRRGAFAACAEELERLQLRTEDFGPSTVQALQFLARFARVLQHLDNAAYQEAEEELRACREQLGSMPHADAVLGETLAEAYRTIADLADEETMEAQRTRLVDLYYRCERRVQQEAYADAVNAVWILRELTLSFRLEDQYGISAQSPHASRSQENLKKLREALEIHDEQPFNYVDASKIRKALAAAFDDAAISQLHGMRFAWQSKNGVKQISGKKLDGELTGRRNDHEHRGLQIGRPVAEAALAYAWAMIEVLVPGALPILEAYPFRPEALVALTSQLATRV